MTKEDIFPGIFLLTVGIMGAVSIMALLIDPLVCLVTGGVPWILR